MNYRALIALILLTLVLAGGTVWYLQATSRLNLPQRLPGADLRPSAPLEKDLDLAQGKLETFSRPTPPAAIPGRWPNFRGALLDNIAVDEKVNLDRQWPTSGPKLLWEKNLGEGYAGAAIYDGRVYLLDYDQAAERDILRCFALEDGKDLWTYSYPIKIKRFHGMSRTVPALTDKYLLTLGPKCHVLCLEREIGKFRWGIDLVKAYGATVPQWYAGQCPLIDAERAIIAPGGKNLMFAVELATGKVLWTTPNPRDWKMTHSSIIPLEVDGQKMFVTCYTGGVAGIAAEDGRLLWETTEWKISIATVPTPVPAGGGKILLTGGYNAGAMMLQVARAGEKWSARPLWRLDPKVFGTEQQTPILYQGNFYAVRQDKQLVCLSPAGAELWASGAANTFGLGPFLVINDLIYALDDEGLLRLVEANATGYQELARARVLNGHDSWGPLAYAAGRLLARDLTRMVCLEIGKP